MISKKHIKYTSLLPEISLAWKEHCESVAAMGRNLSNRKVQINESKTNIETNVSRRLIPLDKNPDVRPIDDPGSKSGSTPRSSRNI